MIMSNHKRAIVSDIHVGVFGSDDVFLKIFKDWASWLAETCHQNGVYKLDILGDLLDDENKLHPKAATAIYEVFSGSWSKFTEINILIGNHDVYHRSSNDVSPITLLQSFKNVTVYFNPIVISNIGSTNKSILFQPWDHSLSKQSLAKWSNIDICYCHAAIRGFEIRKGRLCDNTLDVSAFSKFKSVFSGHFHLSSTIENVTYIGSPYEITMNDIDDNKSFIILDPDTISYTRVYNNFSPKHVKFDASTLVNTNIQDVINTNMHVRLINDIPDQSIYKQVYDAVSKSCLSITDKKKRYTDDLQKEVSMDIDVTKTINPIDTLREYVNSVSLPTNIDPKKLINTYMTGLVDNRPDSSTPGRVDYKRVVMRNFLSVGEESVEIKYTSGGITMVFGQNMDTQDSNGSGKTAVCLDALLFAVFGTTFKTLKRQDAISNSLTSGKTYVMVEFSKNGVEYVIERELAPSRLRLYINGVQLQRSSAQLDLEILKIVSSNYKTYISLIALNISKAVGFIDSTKEGKRSLFEGIFRLQEYSDMLDNAKKHLNDKEDGLKTLLAKETATLVTTTQWITSERDNLTRVLSSIQKENPEVNRIIDLKKAEVAELTNRIVEITNDMILANNNKVSEINQQNILVNNINNKISKILMDKSGYLTEANILREQLNNLSKLSGAVCPTCHSEVKPEHIESIKATVQPKISSKEKEILEKDNLINMAKEKVIEIQKKVGDMTKECQDFSAIYNNNNLLSNQINLIQSEILELSRGVNTSANEAILKNAEFIETKIKDLVSKEEILKKSVLELAEKKSYYELCVTLLGDTGVKQYIFDKVMPQVNKTLSIYMTKLGASYSVQFDTSFGIHMKYPQRPNFEIGNLSEGERQRLDLSVLLTLIQLAISGGTVNTNFMILDEALDTSMDSTGIGDFVSLLKDLAVSNNISVFLTTHNPAVLNNQELAGYKKLIVVKKDGITSLKLQEI